MLRLREIYLLMPEEPILNAARIVARLCPSLAVFEAEFNNMIMN